MTIIELRAELEAVLKDGQGGSFAAWCASEFASHSYPPETLPAARMYGYFLAAFTEDFLEDEANYLGADGSHVDDPGDLDAVCRRVGREAVGEALRSGESVRRAFVRLWCRRFASDGVA